MLLTSLFGGSFTQSIDCKTFRSRGAPSRNTQILKFARSFFRPIELSTESSARKKFTS